MHDEGSHADSKRIKVEREQEIKLVGEFFSAHFGKDNIAVNFEDQTITVNADGDSALIELENNVKVYIFYCMEY
jgi:hypothetical protein